MASDVILEDEQLRLTGDRIQLTGDSGGTTTINIMGDTTIVGDATIDGDVELSTGGINIKEYLPDFIDPYPLTQHQMRPVSIKSTYDIYSLGAIHAKRDIETNGIVRTRTINVVSGDPSYVDSGIIGNEADVIHAYQELPIYGGTHTFRFMGEMYENFKKALILGGNCSIDGNLGVSSDIYAENSIYIKGEAQILKGIRAFEGAQFEKDIILNQNSKILAPNCGGILDFKSVDDSVLIGRNGWVFPPDGMIPVTKLRGLEISHDQNTEITCKAKSLRLENPDFARDTPRRVALEHSDSDELIINKDQSYYGGVRIEGRLHLICNPNDAGLLNFCGINALSICDPRNVMFWADDDVLQIGDPIRGVQLEGSEVGIDSDFICFGRWYPRPTEENQDNENFYGVSIKPGQIECDGESISLTNPDIIGTPNSSRKALTHNDKDELVLNKDGNYKGGVKIDGVTEADGDLIVDGNVRMGPFRISYGKTETGITKRPVNALKISKDQISKDQESCSLILAGDKIIIEKVKKLEHGIYMPTYIDLVGAITQLTNKVEWLAHHPGEPLPNWWGNGSPS